MALSTPQLQARSRVFRDWGNYATVATLPNGSGAPLPARQFALEAGDVASLRATPSGPVFRFVCADPGTPAGGDAFWQTDEATILDVTKAPWNAVGDGVADDGPAIQAAIDSVPWVFAAGDLSRAAIVYCPGKRFDGTGGVYRHTAQIELRKSVTLLGDGGAFRKPATVLKSDVPAGPGGLLLTFSAVAATPSGFGSAVRHLAVQAVGAVAGQHGIETRTRCVMHEVYIEGFGGDGLHVVGSVGIGNVNGSTFSVVQADGCGLGAGDQGIRVFGGDANGCTFNECQAHSCFNGIRDESFLGCLWNGPLVEGSVAGKNYHVANGGMGSCINRGYSEADGAAHDVIAHPAVRGLGGTWGRIVDGSGPTNNALWFGGISTGVGPATILNKNAAGTRIVQAQLGLQGDGQTAFTMYSSDGVVDLSLYYIVFDPPTSGGPFAGKWCLCRDGIASVANTVATWESDATPTGGQFGAPRGVYFLSGATRRKLEYRAILAAPAVVAGEVAGDLIITTNPSGAVTTGWQRIGAVWMPITFLGDRQYTETEGLFSTSGIALATALTISPSLAGGTAYRVEWYGEVSVDAVTEQIRVRMTADAQVLMDVTMPIFATAGAFTPVSGMREIVLGAGVTVFTLSIARVGGLVNSVNIQRRRISIYRVG